MFKRHSAVPTLSTTLAQFTEMVDRHQRELSTFLAGLVNDREQSYDLMQDTFQDAWRSARSGTAPFIAESDDDQRRRWLFRVAYHKAISVLRRRRLLRWESFDLLAESAKEHGDGASSFEEQIVEREALRAALARLAPQDRACLLLCVAHDMSAAEAGRVVGASPQAVAQRLARAKQRLRTIYLASQAVVEE